MSTISEVASGVFTEVNACVSSAAVGGRRLPRRDDGCSWPSSDGGCRWARSSGMLQAAGTGFKLLPVPLLTLGSWYPDAQRALCSVASTIAARGLSTFSRARSILFQSHAALLVTNNALCLMSGLLSDN